MSLTMRAPAAMAVAAAALLHPLPAAASLKTGNDLQEVCTSSENSPTHSQQDANCAGYLAGVVDTMRNFGITEKYRICIDDDVELGQVRDVVKSFLQQHPQVRHNSADGLILGALYQAFPCKG